MAGVTRRALSAGAAGLATAASGIGIAAASAVRRQTRIAGEIYLIPGSPALTEVQDDVP